MTPSFPSRSTLGVFLASTPTKLASLLTFSAGALALAPAAEAQITWSGVLDAKVGFGAGDSASYQVDLPGDVNLLIARPASGRRVFAAYSGFHLVIQRTIWKFIKPAAAGQKWATLGGSAFGFANLGYLTGGGVVIGGNFSHQYALFRFEDTTAGNALRYGWADFSAISGGPNTPSITLHSWAYDASGAEIGAGVTAVPEPQAAALATGAALVLGAAGVRVWRRKRAAVG